MILTSAPAVHHSWSTLDHWAALATIAAAVFTFVTVVVALLALQSANEAESTAEKALNAANESAQASRESVGVLADVVESVRVLQNHAEHIRQRQELREVARSIETVGNLVRDGAWGSAALPRAQEALSHDLIGWEKSLFRSKQLASTKDWTGGPNVEADRAGTVELATSAAGEVGGLMAMIGHGGVMSFDGVVIGEVNRK